MKKKALVLGGSAWQLEIIRRAKDFDLHVLVADISAEAPGRAIAHEFIEIDTNNKEELAKIACEKKVDIVIAEQSDRVVPIAAYINHELGLRGMIPEIANRFTNKYSMRNYLANTDIPMPAYEEIETITDARSFISKQGYPVVIKPKSSQASLGVHKISNPNELQMYFNETKGISTDGKILIEEFVDGVEITVEGFSLDGKCHVLAISEKEHYPHNDCVASRLAYPPRFSEKAIENIKMIDAKVVETLGLVDGISHAEYRMRGDVPMLIEVGARGGGNRIASMIVPHVSGVDMYEMLIRTLLGEKNLSIHHTLWRSAILEFFHFRPGKVKAIHGVEEIQNEGLAQDFVLSFKVGDILQSAADDRHRPGYFIILGESRDETDFRSERIKELIRLEYEPDNRTTKN
jgi:biotin carboxylase